MSEKDLTQFLNKINTLNKLVEFLDKYPKKKEIFSKCSSHHEIVELARHWGFEIGKRWGEE